MRQLLLLTVVACAAPRGHARPGGSGVGMPRVLDAVEVAKPYVDLPVPDVTPWLRWPVIEPLQSTPFPHFSVAAAVQRPGSGMVELCRKLPTRGHGDLIAYVHGWCRALRSQVDLALAEWVPLLDSTVPGLAGAVRLDISDVVVSELDATSAIRELLYTHRLRDRATIDRIAALYWYMGKTQYAVELATIAANGTNDGEAQCQRWARRIALTPSRDVGDYLHELSKNASSELCKRAWAELSCHVDRAHCAAYFAEPGRDPRYGELHAAYAKWPQRAGGEDWLAYAETTARIGLPEAKVVAAAALRAAGRATACLTPRARRIDALAKVLQAPTVMCVR